MPDNDSRQDMLDWHSYCLSDFPHVRLLIGEMNLTDSQILLRSYADHGDEAAFRKLVEQYIDLVYSAAIRRVGGDAGLAQDVTQAVFTDLARKAPSLRDVAMLGGWLHRHTGFIASSMVRSEHRRQVREQEAAQMNATSDSSETLWQQLAPMLDDTIECLDPSDRQAVLLRFFERRDFRAIGDALGISDDAAQKRVTRAVEKLRSLLVERGVTLTVVVLSSLLIGKAVSAAPAGLAADVAKIALAGATASSGMGLTLMKLARSSAVKLSIAALVLAVALWTYRKNVFNSIGELKSPPITATDLADIPHPLPASNSVPAPVVVSAVPANATNDTKNILLLNIIAADSGKPVPNAEFDYWLWINGNVKHNKPLMATRFGVCKVPVPDGTTELMLVSERDGFADTLLDWHTDRGEQIPPQYTLKVARAVPIGGQVVDPDGHPVAGAQVGFNNRADIASQTRPQSDDFAWPFWVTATTDAQGHWQINRIGQAAVRHLDGEASHPNFVRASLDSKSDLNEKQLLAGTYVSTLGHAVVVRGTVKDPNGNPVSGAHVLVGHVAMDTSRSSKSKADGSFSIAGCQPGRTVLSAQAKGFAATTIKVNLADNSGPYDLVLQPGKTLKLRVVDANGNPIPHAQVYYDTFPNHQYDASDPEKYAVTQVDFSKQTDKNGLLEWDSAPDGVLTFDVSASGYMRSNGIKVPSDSREHTVTLQPGMTISGTVVDATTGLPIPRFLIITGWPDIDLINHTTNATWSTIDRFWLSFDGGKFQYTYDEQVLGGVEDPAYMFKFEADGYAPFVTRIVPASEGSAHFDVALAPARKTEVTVLSPDGSPAANVEIGLVSPGCRLSLIPGGFTQNIQSGGSHLQTDDQGQFALPPDSTITKVVAACPQGYAEAAPSDLAANPTLNLLPWGRLEGTYMTNGQPYAGCSLMFKYLEGSMNTLYCDVFAFQAKTDNDGHFVFPEVPPGNFKVMLMLNFHDDVSGASGWSDGPSQTVTIVPGITNTITIDNTNGVDQIPFRLFRPASLP
jgi:RNA polymerase sigma factor (sigma-70 family)